MVQTIWRTLLGSGHILGRLLLGLRGLLDDGHLGLVHLLQGVPLLPVVEQALQHGSDLHVEAAELLKTGSAHTQEVMWSGLSGPTAIAIASGDDWRSVPGSVCVPGRDTPAVPSEPRISPSECTWMYFVLGWDPWVWYRASGELEFCPRDKTAPIQVCLQA